MTIVTRFAPSPTGYLHIGGARTALFNWLYANHMNGKFLLRIEDTDKARNTPEAINAIYGGLAWLGLNSSEPTVLQSDNVARHVEVANELLDMNLAYLDEGAVRIRGTKGSQTIEDLVQGTVTWPQDIDDFVILRADGTPTYMLAVVVDDHDMGVTHVIRGDDHLNNAFRQLSIYRAMGWHQPTYGHIPLIMDENGKKLSKRTGAAAVEDYRDMGILPQAMVNYLARLGWGHGNHELFDMAQAVKWFDIKDVGRNPARLDMKKLRNINGHYIRSADPEELAYLVDDMLPHGVDHATLLGAVKALQERSADLNALAAGTMFLWANRPIALAEPLSAEDKGILMNVLACLTMATWTQEGLHKELNVATIACQLKLGKVVAPLRMALTGSKISPPITDTLILLGRDESLNRIRDAL